MNGVQPSSRGFPLNTDEDYFTDAQKALKFLLFERELSFSDVSRSVLSAILWFKDRAILDEALIVFQNVLDGIIQTEQLDEIMIGNLLALLPFFEPDFKNISIPQKVDGVWRKVSYFIEPINLTPESFGSPFQAYGLTSAFPNVPPILLFRGTSHPTCSGALWSYWADFVPFGTPGELLYRRYVREKVALWLKSNPGARVYGQSLGGSLALMTACEHPGAISEVHAYGAPTPFARFLKTYDGGKDKVSLYHNENDPIPLLGGDWHSDWSIYTLKGGSRQSPVAAHARVLSARKGVTIEQTSERPLLAKIQRIALNFLYQLVSIPLFFGLTILLLGKFCYISAKNMVGKPPTR